MSQPPSILRTLLPVFVLLGALCCTGWSVFARNKGYELVWVVRACSYVLIYLGVSIYYDDRKTFK